MSHWFFLSYARDDNKDGYVKKFYEDLRRAVAGKTGTINENEAGFFDGEAIEPGTKWSQELGDALQQSRCFISVFSPTYFQKKFCGKEWSVFDERQAAYAATLAAGAPTPNLMIPILWEKKKYVEPVIPSALSAIQFNHDDFGDKYTEYGLRQMMKLNKFRDAYESFIDVFSDKLIDTARTHLLPPLPNLAPLETITPTFPASIGTGTIPVPVVIKPNDGANPRYVKFVFVVGPQAELQAAQLRTKLDHYGASGAEWHPYLPDALDDVDIMVKGVVLQEKLSPEDSFAVDGDLLDKIGAADKLNQIVVIVVDTWTLQLQNYRQIMKNADEKLQFTNCIMLVPWNEKDEESVKNIEKLQATVKAAFENRILNNSPNFLSRISSVDELKAQLSMVLQRTKMKLIERSDIRRKAIGDVIISKSTITGPGGA